MVIPQTPSQHASGLRVGGPFLHALRVAQRGQPFRQVNKALMLAPVTLTQGAAQGLAARLGAVSTGPSTLAAKPVGVKMRVPLSLSCSLTGQNIFLKIGLNLPLFLPLRI